MPKFIYTVILFCIILWAIIVRYAFSTPPITFFKIAVLLTILFFALTFTISLPFYLYFHTKAPTFSNLRFLYHRSFKWGAFLSFGITFYFGLKAFNLDSLLNTVLFFVFYLLLFIQLRTKR
ncbi:hypothetical protein A2V49_00620 [candidate division WWE3 bacterium RBG_19FT_COMBO_34_6]|uniref:Uncharacterized protein n=1 Tax=candidate division WWE3 bacterium RBG_19FT_COMBO_34_6 TaxID=1802612 RepID=A0A1F4UNI7_UNCKA|nr:MAG: hypothetical protein A2V49_00620 [candidate division WWE3 bacterium RBG_19FT_COMBO_34_6]